MARVFADKDVLRKVAPHDGLSKNLKAFMEACRNNKSPPRVYKQSGMSNDGKEFVPYLDLNLHHHHLHNNGDPLLITQNIDDCIYCIGVATHADYILGDKMKWLKAHAHKIDWTGCEHHQKKVEAYEPPDEIDC